MCSNYSRSVCETQNSMTINIHDVCNGIYTIILCLWSVTGDAEQRARENGEPNKMDNLCLAFVRWPGSAGVRVFVCFNYKSLFIVATATRADGGGGGGTTPAQTCSMQYGCMAFLHYRSPSPLSSSLRFLFFVFFFFRPSASSTDSFPFYSIAGCSFTRRQHVFFFLFPLPFLFSYFTIIWHLSSVKSTSGI